MSYVIYILLGAVIFWVSSRFPKQALVLAAMLLSFWGAKKLLSNSSNQQPNNSRQKSTTEVIFEVEQHYCNQDYIGIQCGQKCATISMELDSWTDNGWQVVDQSPREKTFSIYVGDVMGMKVDQSFSCTCIGMQYIVRNY